MIDFWLIMGTKAIQGEDFFQNVTVPVFQPSANAGFYEIAATGRTATYLPRPHFGRVPNAASTTTATDPTGDFRAALRKMLADKWQASAPPVSYYTASKFCQLYFFESSNPQMVLSKQVPSLAQSLKATSWSMMETALIGLALIDGIAAGQISSKDALVAQEFNTSLDRVADWMNASGSPLSDAQDVVALLWSGGCGEGMFAYPGGDLREQQRIVT